MKSIPIFLFISLQSAATCFFHPSNAIWKRNTAQRSSELFAKTSKNKRKKNVSKSSTGGFGSAPPAKTSKPTGDYAIFPALEAPVQQSLVSSPTELLEPGVLTLEVYDRLEQIYGFSNFNYEKIVADSEGSLEEQGGMSFSDLISSVEDDSSAASDSKMSDSDFSDLLAAATGAPTPSTPTKVVEKLEALSEIDHFSDFRVLHMDPLVLAIDNFFSEEECDRYVQMSIDSSKNEGSSGPMQIRSRTVGKDAQAKAQRTSTTWFHHYEGVPELMAKASRLLGLETIDQWEEPQTVRYRRNEKFTWHLDALSPEESTTEKGGQRIATLLVYLTEMSSTDGGATIFRDLSDPTGRLRMQPKKGSALLFFPSAGGIPNSPLDIRTLHCGEIVSDEAPNDKWIAQLWLREAPYTPTAPPGNTHDDASAAIASYCNSLR